MSSHSPAFKRAGLQMASAQAPEACGCGWKADGCQVDRQPQHTLPQPVGIAVPLSHLHARLALGCRRRRSRVLGAGHCAHHTAGQGKAAGQRLCPLVACEADAQHPVLACGAGD